jgi:8-oxo-dGTP pyrophosphatase MutT (NUDIX family)
MDNGGIHDHREIILELLNRYQPFDGNDQKQQERIKKFVLSTPNCFKRTHLEGHITGSAWLMNKMGDKVLLTHHKKLDRWLQLGGHADGDTDIFKVALREAQEESGLEAIEAVSLDIFDVDVHLIPGYGLEPEHFHYDIRFAMQANGGEDFVVSPESRELAWVPVDQVEKWSKEESLLRMARKWRDRMVKKIY